MTFLGKFNHFLSKRPRLEIKLTVFHPWSPGAEEGRRAERDQAKVGDRWELEEPGLQGTGNLETR